MLTGRTTFGVLMKITSCFSSQAQGRSSILLSQFHKLGSQSTTMARRIQLLLSPYLPSITSTQQELNQLRQKVMKAGVKGEDEKEPKKKALMEDYLNSYGRLVRVIEKCPLNNQWIYKTIGWYNMTSFYRLLLNRLLESEDEQEIISLANCMSQMSYTWDNPYGIIDQSIFKPQLLPNFYKRLMKLRLDPPVLRKIESILPVPLNFFKRRLFERYFNSKIEELLKYLRITDSYSLNDLLWLMQAYVKNMNDSPQGIAILEQHLVTERPVLSAEDIDLLIEAYQLKGGINKNIYQIYIKPHILRHKMAAMDDLIDMIKFTICSESGDAVLLKQLYELVAVKYKSQKLAKSRQAYTLHLYTHYLLIKGYKIRLPAELEKELTAFCKQRSEGRDNVSRMVKTEVMQKKKQYVSACLDTQNSLIREFQQTSRSVFQQKFTHKLRQLNLAEYKIHEKPIFCCFQLDYALEHKKLREFMDVEIEGIQYVFSSGKLTRERQIRDEMLEHYNFKITHIDYNLFRQATFDEDEKLMNRRLTP